VKLLGRPKKTRKPDQGMPKTIGYRVSGPYGDWLEDQARKYRTTVAGFIDRAVAEWTVGNGDEPPPERMP
jgi:hypothetical protein